MVAADYHSCSLDFEGARNRKQIAVIYPIALRYLPDVAQAGIKIGRATHATLNTSVAPVPVDRGDALRRN